MIEDSTTTYTFVNTAAQLEEVCELLDQQAWISFDTEFIGEKRYFTLLCLLQVNCPEGSFLIDPMALPDLNAFFKVIENPKVLKITHAGENDYRILYNSFKVLPKNIFDTQIAAGFVGYNYPTAFRKIVEKELKVRLKKGFAVAEWDNRPLSDKHLQYALNDVIYLNDLYIKLSNKLKSSDRQVWCKREMDKLETAAHYYVNPHAEALNNNMMPHLGKREQIFMLRLFDWRKQEAKRKDYSKEMILQGKYINHIVKNIQQGPAALKNNRLLPKTFFKKYGEVFMNLYERPASEEEQLILKEIPVRKDSSPFEDITHDILYALIKRRCIKQGVSQNLLFSKSSLKLFRKNPDWLGGDWRTEVLGDSLVNLLKRSRHLKYNFEDGKFVLE